MNWEDFNRDNTIVENYQQYIPTNIRCPKCNIYLRFNNSVVLTCMPPKYQYSCACCGWVGTSYRKWDGRLL